MLIQEQLSNDIDVILVSVASQNIPRSAIRTITIGVLSFHDVVSLSNSIVHDPLSRNSGPRLKIGIRLVTISLGETPIPIKSISTLLDINFIIHVI
jgi:hypothetical protein